MPMILRGPSVAANSTNENLLSGSSFEFARGRGVMSCGITADAAGIIANIQAGGDIVAEAFPVPVLARYPIIPDEMYFTEVVEVGDRLVQRVQNTTGAPMVVRSVTQLSFGGWRVPSMWRPVQGNLAGFLSLLGLKNLGQNPDELSGQILPTIDVTQFFLEGSAQNFERTFQSVNNATQNGAYGHAVVVPEGEAWWVHHATMRIGTPLGVTSIAIHAAQVLASMPLPASELRGEPFTLDVGTPTPADDDAMFATPSLRNFWAPPGTTIYGGGCIDILDGGGATLFTIGIDVRFTPVKI